MKTLFVSDLDGTLLDAEAHLSRRSAELLNLAVSRGALFTVATARTPATVDVLLEKVDMQLPAIVFTGAALWHFDTRTYSDVKFISRPEVETVCRIFGQFAITPFVYTLSPDEEHILRVYYGSTNPGRVDRKFIEDRSHLKLKRFCVGAQLPANRKDSVVLFYASGAPDVVRVAAEALGSQTGCAVSFYDDIYNPDTALIEVFAPGVSKASAITTLRQRVGADSVVVFGDNLNDVAMFEVADRGVAVANALPAVRDRADEIIGTNTADSVAQCIYEFSQ